MKVKVEISGIDMTQDVGPLIKSYYPKHEVEIKYIDDISETANIVNTKINSEEKVLGENVEKSDSLDEQKEESTDDGNDKKNELSNDSFEKEISECNKIFRLSLRENEFLIFLDNELKDSETFNYIDSPDPHMPYEKRKRRAYKNQLLRALFRVLSEETGRKRWRRLYL